MVGPEQQKDAETPPSPADVGKGRMGETLDEYRDTVQGAADDAIREVSPKERMLRELARRRETGEISPHDFDPNIILWLNQENEPLRYSDIITHYVDEAGLPAAVVLTYESMREIGVLDYIRRTGEREKTDFEDCSEDDVFILFPEELGESEGEPRLEIS